LEKVTTRLTTPLNGKTDEMHLEIFSELPSTTLLFPPRGTIVRQVGVGIIVKKSWHDDCGRLRQSAMDV
jgi:hypothetical protein